MLSIGVGETVTDGFKTYVLTSEFDYKFVSYGNHAQHHVSPEVLKMLVDQKHSLTVNIAGDKLGAECSDLTSSERLDVFDYKIINYCPMCGRRLAND